MRVLAIRLFLAIVLVGCALGSPATPTSPVAPATASGTTDAPSTPGDPTRAPSSSVAPPTASAAPDDPPSEAPARGFGPASVEHVIDLLARAGIAVRARPADAPVVAVGSPSPVGLLRFQARNLALEASAQGGTRGEDLDALVVPDAGLPVSALFAGWARTADTEASRAAVLLVPDVATSRPPDLVIPSLALFLMLADVTSSAGTAAGPAGAALAVAPAGFCAEVSAYLAAALAGVLDATATLDVPWLQDAIDLYRDVLRDDPEALRRSVGAMALLAYATSVARPWTTFLVASPQEVHHIVGGDELTSPTKELRLAVDVGSGAPSEEAAECAELAGIELEETELEGTPVAWVPGGLSAHITDVEGDLELDERGHAIYEYQTIGETAEAHREGTLRTATFDVGAIVQRRDLEQLADSVRALVTAGGTGRGGAAVAAAYDRLRPQLDTVLFPVARARVEVSWHTEKEEQKAVWVVVDRAAQPPLTAGRTLELVSCDGPYGPWEGYLALGGLSADELRIPLQPLPMSFSFPGKEGVQSTRTRVAGSIDAVVFTMNVDYDFQVRTDGRTLSLAGQGRSDTSVGFGIGGPVSLPDLPIQPAPAGKCPAG